MSTTQSSDLLRTQEVENGVLSSRVSIVPRGHGYGVSATTGTIAAALAANSSIFAMRLDPGSSRRAFIERVRIEFTCLVAYTVPITAGRRLGLYRGTSTANASGGTALVPPPKHGNANSSEFSTVNGGDVRISTTGALTTAVYTYEAVAFREMSLTHAGTAGAFREVMWEFSAPENQPIQLEPGQVLAIRNPLIMDAAGTWQATIGVDWHEAPALDYA